jgi:hypothetical protein
MAIALAGPLKPSAAHGRWAKHMFDRALELFLRRVSAGGGIPPAVPYGITATERGDGDGELYAARMAAAAVQAATMGLGRLRSEAPRRCTRTTPTSGGWRSPRRATTPRSSP